MRWNDRVYGAIAIDDPALLDLIAGLTFQRLKGIRQAGPSALAFPFKSVTRYEHSLGVHHLLSLLGAGRRERVAGLLHDISHTAFSHAVDFVFASEEQDHHEGLKPEFLRRPDVVAPLAAMGFAPDEFFDDSIYPLLERPLPWLCGDRVDYFLRDSLACGVTTPAQVSRFLAHLTVVGETIAFDDESVARDAADQFALMNRDWWASPTEAFVYNEFAKSLNAGLALGVLRPDDFLEDDAHVLAALHASGLAEITAPLARVLHFREEALSGYRPKVQPKTRWLDPPVLDASGLRRLSERT